jgi:1,4-alpha-glucan branching enzyme
MAMTDSGWTAQYASGQSLIQEMNALIDNRYEDKWANAEMYIDSSWVIDTLGFDAQYHVAFRDAVRNAILGAASGNANMGAIAATVNGTGGSFQTTAFNYYELHDDAWPLNGNERLVKQIDTTFPHDDEYAAGRTKVASGITLTAQGTPAILQGTEWLEDDGWESYKIDWSHKVTYSGIFARFSIARSST